MREFSDAYRIGRTKGAGLLFDAEDKARIGELLAAEGIAADISPDVWDGIARAQALRSGAGREVRRRPRSSARRVAIKTLPGRPLCLAGQALLLPPVLSSGRRRPRDSPASSPTAASCLVENWESFDRIHDTDLDLSPAGENPLVLWRGDSSDTRADHALALLRTLGVPVWAFVDYDPAGLLIAAALPGLAGIIVPPPERLEADLARGLPGALSGPAPHGRCDPGCCTNEQVRGLWALIRRHGRALPQERYLIEPGQGGRTSPELEGARP